MSTLLNSATDFSAPADRPLKLLSLSDLTEILLSQTEVPSLAQVNAWLARSDFSEEEIKPYVGFKEANYWRHRVCRNEFVEMLVLCWRPGHKTPIHDHNGSHGAVKVHRGVLWETNFWFEPQKGLLYKDARECRRNEITGAEIPDIHQLGNPEVSGQNLITIHVYAPPLGVLRTYKVGSPEVDLYIPDDTDV